ncbi:MAG: F0F1 ATP synthase subunit B [Verrucomicrobia bacterium]|nr:F0F1 ATP synthase subunit B [Verrucomicrobiota bacterium]
MEHTLQTLGIQWPKLIAQVINFAIVLFVLWRWAYKPVLSMLAVRRGLVEESVTNAEKIKADLARTEEERKKILGDAGVQASKIIEETRKAAEAELAKRSQEALATANDIIAKARQANEAELARMKAELRKEVGRLVVDTTAKVTGKILTVEDHQRLAQETTRQLAA